MEIANTSPDTVKAVPVEPTLVVKVVYGSLPFLLTMLLIVLTLVFTSRAFKKIVRVQTSIQAIF